MVGHVQFFSMVSGSAMPGKPAAFEATGEGLSWTTLRLDPLGIDGDDGAGMTPTPDPCGSAVRQPSNSTWLECSSDNETSPALPLSRRLQATSDSGSFASDTSTAAPSTSDDKSVGLLAEYLVDRYELAPYYGQLISSIIFMACVFLLRVLLLGCFLLGQSLSDSDPEEQEEQLGHVGNGLDTAAQLMLVSNDAVSLASSTLVAESGVGNAVGSAVDELGINVDIKCCGCCAGIPVVGDCIVGMNVHVCGPLFAAVPQLQMLVDVFSEGSLIDRLQFPALECFAAVFALPGMAQASTVLLSSGDDIAIATGSVMLMLLVLFIGVTSWLLLFQLPARLSFDDESAEYIPNDDDDLFLKLYHGYSFADFRPGGGQAYLFLNILVAFSRSVAFGAYMFGCPAGQAETCGQVQLVIVFVLMAEALVLLSILRPYNSGDDQTVEEVSAWCNVLTLAGMMALPSAAGTQHEEPLAWALILLQVVSIGNQMWYNLKPLILGIADYVHSKLCSPRVHQSDVDDDDGSCKGDRDENIECSDASDEEDVRGFDDVEDSSESDEYDDEYLSSREDATTRTSSPPTSSSLTSSGGDSFTVREDSYVHV